ncbi:LOW QUALITY PROTEIN: calicin [Morus bassanus]
MLMLNSHSGPLAQMEIILSDRKQERAEDCFLFQGKGSLIDAVMILGGQKEDVRFNDEGFAYTFELTYFAYMWLKLIEMACKTAAPSATLADSVTGGITDQITTSKTAQGPDIENNSWTEYGGGRKENWTLTAKISNPMDAAALITMGKKSLIDIMTRQLNGCFLYVQMVDYFDTTGKVVQYLTFHIEFNHKPVLSFPQDNILSVHSSKKKKIWISTFRKRSERIH